jgi:hypothetical protein
MLGFGSIPRDIVGVFDDRTADGQEPLRDLGLRLDHARQGVPLELRLTRSFRRANHVGHRPHRLDLHAKLDLAGSRGLGVDREPVVASAGSSSRARRRTALDAVLLLAIARRVATSSIRSRAARASSGGASPSAIARRVAGS